MNKATMVEGNIAEFLRMLHTFHQTSVSETFQLISIVTLRCCHAITF